MTTSYTEDQYNEAIAFLEKYKNTEPTDEELMVNYVDDKTDEEHWNEMPKNCVIRHNKEGKLIDNKPKLDRILSKALESIVLVDGIPKTNRDRFERLKANIEGKIKTTAENSDRKVTFEIKQRFYPFYDEKDESEGYALFQLQNEQQAREFQHMFNNFRHTKKIVWTTYNLSTIDKYLNVKDVWVPPEIKEKQFNSDLESWLNEDDQFLIIQNSSADIYKNKCGYGISKIMAPSGPELLVTKPNIASEDWDSVRWSTQGTYLLVFDLMQRGVGLFGTNNFNKPIERFACVGAFNAEFSPDERFILFQSGRTDASGCYEESDIKPEVSVWSVLDNQQKKKFIFEAGIHCAYAWERFQWSHDGRFLCTTKQDHLCVFDAWNDFKPLIDPNSKTGHFIHVPGLHSYTLSPTDNYVCYWVPEADQRPLRVVVRELPSLNIISTKNLFKVKDLEMLWHPQGTYLALRCAKTMKGRKSALFSAFELFHIKEKEVPVDVVECRDYIQDFDPLDPTKTFATQPPGGFAWEPTGNRFAVYYGPNDNVSKTIIKIFKPVVGNKIIEIPVLERTNNYNSISWCPTGRYLILAQFRRHQASGGALEWLDVDGEIYHDSQNKFSKKSKELRKPTTLATQNHQFMTNLTWDSTGRYVVTSSSMFEHKMENGYAMWNFQGKELYSKKMDKFCQFSWRPRPKSILSEKQLKEINSNIKEYAKQFHETDALRSTKHSAEEQARLLKMMNSWNSRQNFYDEERKMQAEYVRELHIESELDEFEDVETNTLLKASNTVVSTGFETL